jgi:hypothetical protein
MGIQEKKSEKGGNVNSEIIRAVGLGVVQVIEKEIDDINTHPFRWQFDEEGEIRTHAAKEEARKIKGLVVEYLNKIYRESL